MKRGCSVVAVTFISPDHCSHVLLRVRHLANGVVVFLESRVFSSLAKLLHYCSTVWGKTSTKEISKLQLIQNFDYK